MPAYAYAGRASWDKGWR